jgi:hypothetical protein
MPLAKDTLFEISDFNVPKIISNADAWAEIILNLLFLENGTYSDAPALGLDLKNHSYMTSEDIISYVTSELSSQVSAYMPEIPLSNVSVVVKTTNNGNSILYITLSFRLETGVINKSAFVSLNDEIVDAVVEDYYNKYER